MAERPKEAPAGSFRKKDFQDENLQRIAGKGTLKYFLSKKGLKK